MGKKAFAERSTLAKNIISRRNAKDWSQQDLADASRFHINIIKKIENDKGEGELDTRKAIAAALGCTMSDLYAEENGGLIHRDLLNGLIHDSDDRQCVEGIAHMVALFAQAPPKLRALVIAFLAHDFSLAREYFSAADLGRLMPPPKDR